MSGCTVKQIDDMESIFHGALKRAAAELGIESFGMQVVDMPPGFAEYPEHDHSDDGQEEVYVVLRGTAELEADGRRWTLGCGGMARVEPGTRRKLYGGPDGARVLAIGAVPGRVYSRPRDFTLGAPDLTLPEAAPAGEANG
jgi:quercetin dioxygenase-like cupin family protein